MVKNMTQREIADIFGLDQTRISQILSQTKPKTDENLGVLEINTSNNSKVKKKNVKLNKTEREEVIELRNVKKVQSQNYLISQRWVWERLKPFKSVPMGILSNRDKRVI